VVAKIDVVFMCMFDITSVRSGLTQENRLLWGEVSRIPRMFQQSP